MKKKYYLLLTIFVFVILIITLAYNFYSQEQTKIRLLNNSSDFVKSWGNYTDSTSENYFNSIAPYVSVNILIEYQESAQIIKQNRGDKEPSKSTLTLKGGAKIKKTKKGYDVEVPASRKYSFQKESFNQVVYLKWSKVGSKYIISEVYTDK